MKRLLLLLSLVAFTGLLHAKKVASPNGKITVQTTAKGCKVFYQNQLALEIPVLGLGDGVVSMTSFRSGKKVYADYQMLSGKHQHCSNAANEYRMTLTEHVTLVMRLYNDGVAFRYEGKALVAKKEQTVFCIPEGMKRWMQQWADSYEGFFPLSTTSKMKALPSYSAVTKDSEGNNLRWGYPLLIEPVDGVFTLLTEANIERGQSASCLYNNGDMFKVVADDVFDGQTIEHTPWRVAIIGTLADVVESTLVTDVSEPCKLSDTSWIHPGVVSWIYWAYNHGSNDYNIIKKYVDLAVALHLPYVLIDAEWDEMDKVKTNGGKTIEDAVAYAKSQGIRPMIWYNSSVGWIDGAPTPKFRLNKAEDREKEFAWCERIGVAGVKIDFFSGDSQKNMDFCLDLLESAARHHLLVNFHGATVPRGWYRTYPNLLSTEGVYGAEWYNNVGTFTAKAAAHNATLPFTRNVIGPMDYTPCAFSDSQHPHITTHAHELALTVLFESGLQHIADRPESLLAQPKEVQRFFAELPAAWDETRYVSGYPGESVVLARRKGNTWYVAGINGSDNPKTLSIPHDFIKGKHGRVEVFADEGDHSWKLSTIQEIPSEVSCRARGGFVFVIHPKGTFVVRQLSENAVRIQYQENQTSSSLPEWIYVKNDVVKSKSMTIAIDNDRESVSIKDKQGRVVFEATGHQLQGKEATLTLRSPSNEHLYGLGQFQDGYTNVRGLPRRLTQVNTQISIPMIISDLGYGLLWNNYGLTEFNPSSQYVKLSLASDKNGSSDVEVVNVTSTEGGKKEVRERNIFEATIDITEAGQYALLLDVGQKMARRHNLSIDGQPVIEMKNLWLPPTASALVTLSSGRHTLTAELSKGDSPILYYNKVKDETVFRSPVADAVDYTVFVGSPDEIIASYRSLTGTAPLMPQWALGYIHCRERFHSSDEILQTASRFRREQLPVDLIVQDWQYWGKYGWNSMRFDEANYPDPKALTDQLHQQNMRLMVSVWSKIDKNSEVGRQMLAQNRYIPGTDWIDFFNADAAKDYWKNFSERLVPLGIDAWWQDATEPENDDLVGRRVNNGLWAGEQVRNVYPLLVNKTVYEGLLNAQPMSRPMILTRCGFPGIQRYGSALWSGDVGNDWETFRRQITAGLGMQAAGIPWWTYDAGGFFRPGNQYNDSAYKERLLRWVETSVYLPLMRVHGYMSNTEPWNYGASFQQAFATCLKERYRLLPYIYSNAAAIAFEGSTLMRPLVFDFANDPQALRQKYEYMFGRSLLVNPITEPGVTTWKTYLPKNAGGWYNLRNNEHFEGGMTVTTSADRIPVFVRGGSILPLSSADKQYASHLADAPLVITVCPGADATFTLYEDDGSTMAYQEGQCSRITFLWNDAKGQLVIGQRQGSFAKMPAERTFHVMLMSNGLTKSVNYQGKKLTINL